MNDINDILVLYLLGHISAFDTLIPCSAVHFAENTGFIFYKIASMLHLSSIEPINPILPFISKPIVTNTYTTLYPFYIDFGYLGIVLFSVFIGFIMGYIYKKAYSGSQYFILLFAYFGTVIIFQFVGDLFLTNMGAHIRVIMLLLLPYIIGTKNTHSIQND